MPCARPAASGAPSTRPREQASSGASDPAAQDKYEFESHPRGRGDPGLLLHGMGQSRSLGGHSRSPVAREPRRDLGPKCTRIGAQQGQGSSAWVPGTELGRRPRRLERVTCRRASSQPGARLRSRSPGRSRGDEFLSSTLPGSSSRTTGRAFYSRRLIKDNSESDF